MRRIFIVLCAIFAVNGLGTAEAQSGCISNTCVYLPLPLKAPTDKVVVLSSSTFVPYDLVFAQTERLSIR
jgi:hypothetical protein